MEGNDYEKNIIDISSFSNMLNYDNRMQKKNHKIVVSESSINLLVGDEYVLDYQVEDSIS